MSDLINRADAIEAVHEYYQKRFTEDSKWDANAKMFVLEDKTIAKDNMEICNIIKALPSADAVQGEWIPCSERLPKEKARVLTYDTMGDVVFGQYDKGKWYWEAEACADYWAKNDGVIAWMPLPKPYKGGAK